MSAIIHAQLTAPHYVLTHIMSFEIQSLTVHLQRRCELDHFLRASSSEQLRSRSVDHYHDRPLYPIGQPIQTTRTQLMYLRYY